MSRIKIKNCTYYFFNDMTNIKNFDPNRIITDKKPHKNIIIYYSGYITFKNLSYTKINSVSPLHFIIDKADRYIDESNGNKCFNAGFY